MPKDKPKSGWLTKRRQRWRVKRAQRGPSSDAQQERRNADKNFDPTAVARKAGKYLPP
jgi:hypothetical protein